MPLPELRNYPAGFAHLGDDIAIELHIVDASDIDAITRGAARTPDHVGSLFAYLTDLDTNPGFHDTFGFDITPDTLYAAVCTEGFFVFAGGAQPAFIIRKPPTSSTGPAT